MINPDGLAPAPVRRAGLAERRAYLRALEGEGPEEWPWESLSEHLDCLAATRPALTLVPSIGHGAVREVVLGSEPRVPSAGQLDEMRREVRLGLEAGARMLSYGSLHPRRLRQHEGLAAVAREAAPFGVPRRHVRGTRAPGCSRRSGRWSTSRGGRVRRFTSRHSAKALSGDALVEPLLELIDAAAAEIDVTFDQYPYGAGATLLASLLPAWAQAGGAAATLARAADPGTRRAIAHDVRDGLPGWENLLGTLGAGRIVVGGRTLAQRGGDVIDTICDLLLESDLAAPMILHYASDEAVRTIAAHRLHPARLGSWQTRRSYCCDAALARLAGAAS